jgi:hypothetical protein
VILVAIRQHPDTKTRDHLTQMLFNLIKIPDENQRRVTRPPPFVLFAGYRTLIMGCVVCVVSCRAVDRLSWPAALRWRRSSGRTERAPNCCPSAGNRFPPSTRSEGSWSPSPAVPSLRSCKPYAHLN